MKVFIGLVVFAVIAGSVYADYKWRQWMETRRQVRRGAAGEQQGRHSGQ